MGDKANDALRLGNLLGALMDRDNVTRLVIRPIIDKDGNYDTERFTISFKDPLTTEYKDIEYTLCVEGYGEPE